MLGGNGYDLYASAAALAEISGPRGPSRGVTRGVSREAPRGVSREAPRGLHEMLYVESPWTAGREPLIGFHLPMGYAPSL